MKVEGEVWDPFQHIRLCCKPLLGQLSFEVDNLARTDLHKLPYCGYGCDVLEMLDVLI